MQNQVFVGGLSWGIDNEQLKDAFQQFGKIVQAKVVTDRDSGRSRGFGFVTFETEEEASDAIEQMDGRELDGRAIRVNAAEPRRDDRAPRRDRNAW